MATTNLRHGDNQFDSGTYRKERFDHQNTSPGDRICGEPRQNRKRKPDYLLSMRPAHRRGGVCVGQAKICRPFRTRFAQE